MPSPFASEWIPQRLRRAGNRLLGAATTYRGPFQSWNDARASTRGYDEDAILRRVVGATQRVLLGEARYEQDGVAFLDAPPASHALASLLAVAAAEGGSLRVVDFGGGLASHYLRWLPYLADIPSVHWCVVEQPHFAEAGRKMFTDSAHVSFTSTLEETVNLAPNAVLASSVLQYLEFPMDTLNALAALGPRLLVLDRTPFSRDGLARILAQQTPAKHGRANYPLWMLSREEIHEVLEPRYSQHASFASADQSIAVSGLRADFGGGAWWRAT